MIVLDTHAWIWWVAGSKKLPLRIRRRIDRARSLGVCAISCWEVAMLVLRGRLKLDRDTRAWIEQALAAPSLELIPIDAEIGVTAAQLAPFGGDPVDHLIVATALLRSSSLVSADERIADSGLVRVIW